MLKHMQKVRIYDNELKTVFTSLVWFSHTDAQLMWYCQYLFCCWSNASEWCVPICKQASISGRWNKQRLLVSLCPERRLWGPFTPKFHQIRVRSVCALPRQQSWYVSTLVYVCVSTGCCCFAFLLPHSYGDLKPSTADMQGFCFHLMSEPDVAKLHSLLK